MKADVIIIGAGLAGLTVALSLPADCQVLLLDAAPQPIGASAQALGGMAAVLDPADSLDAHTHDTYVAGAQHGPLTAIQNIVRQAPQAVQWLADLGVPFDRHANQDWHLTREGGHSQRRIVHVADTTGAAVMQALVSQLSPRGNIHPRFGAQVVAVDVDARKSTDFGNPPGAHLRVEFYDAHTQSLHHAQAPQLVLATGGYSGLYARCTNAAPAWGLGLALAERLGAALQDLEFVQFHPTCWQGDGVPWLLTEALRGEGALLLDRDFQRFLPHYDARAELAPRDVVARAITTQMRHDGAQQVWLDARHLGKETLSQHFPRAMHEAAQRGLCLAQDLIPVAPAAHYSCGGVRTDLSARTTVPGVYAVGEVACTGLHGANRLASNSLLECVVMGRAAAQAITQSSTQTAASSLWVHDSIQNGATNHVEKVHRYPHELEQRNRKSNPIQLRKLNGYSPLSLPKQSDYPPNLAGLQQLMQHYVGLCRDQTGLEYALQHINDWHAQIKASIPSLAMRNWALQLEAARLVTQAALARRTSLGAHYREDALPV